MRASGKRQTCSPPVLYITCKADSTYLSDPTQTAMNKTLFLLLILITCAVSAQTDPAIIPQPVSVKTKAGSFTLKDNFSIHFNKENPETKFVANYLHTFLIRATGQRGTVSRTSGGDIRLRVVNDKTMGKEAYQLTVTPDSVAVVASSGAGLFYGVQSLLQLFPKEIERRQTVTGIQWTIPCVEIADAPRFGWRGFLLDVSRHFFTKQEVKDFIDQMVRYKYNVLHLHLTDDQGWRIEIKSLPKLTSVGAWRAERVGYWAEITKPTPDEPRTYGGFYTQDDIRELIAYAKERFVEIMPEIEMPGHALAMIAAYPELTCTPGEYQVNAGEKFIDWRKDGFSALVDNNLCPPKEIVYTYLDKIFTEVASLFPFEYIHMGGDECAKNLWEKDESIQALMKKEKLTSMDEVQSYFVKRVQKIIASKGKKMMGWDEIMEGGLAPGAAIMSWRGMKGGTVAASMGHPVVMTPTSHVYVDFMQGDATVEPPSHATLRLKQTYSFDPMPQGVDPKWILGGQVNIWTERITNPRALQYMVWPRGLSIAESIWSPVSAKNWTDFVRRTEQHMQRMDEADVKYATSMYDCIFKPQRGANGELEVVLSAELDGLDIYYSVDETNPDAHYPRYTNPVRRPKDAVHLKVVTYRNGKQVGKLIRMPFKTLEERLSK